MTVIRLLQRQSFTRLTFVAALYSAVINGIGLTDFQRLNDMSPLVIGVLVSWIALSTVPLLLRNVEQSVRRKAALACGLALLAWTTYAVGVLTLLYAPSFVLILLAADKMD